MVAGNSQTHEINIYPTALVATAVPGATATVNMAGGTPGTFVYAAFPGPVVLDAGATYYFMCHEQTPGDTLWGTTTCVTTADAAIFGGTVLPRTIQTLL